MAAEQSNINTINFFDNRQVLKNLNVIKPKGLKVREPKKIGDRNENEIDENIYAKPKLSSFIKVDQRSSLITIPGPTKPAFSVYCDDDLAQDACNANSKVLIRESKSDEILATDLSTWREGCSGNDISQPSVSKVVAQKSPACDVGKKKSPNEKNVCNEDDILSSKANDKAMIFHSARSVSDPDEVVEEDEQQLGCHPDYERDVYLYMRQRECDLSSNSQYLYKQTDISSEMRYVLVDWLADVTLEYHLSLESLHLAVSIVDRILSKLYCPRLKLQLIGATAIMVAAKFEEIRPPKLKEFVYITDETYSATQILLMEKVILNTLCFDISAPTTNWFGARLTRIACSEKETCFLMNYLLELALLDYHYLQYRSSVLACAAFCLANVITGNAAWSSSLEYNTGISLKELKEPLHCLLTSFTKAPNSEHKAVYEKYSNKKYRTVACLLPPSCLPI